MFISIQIIENGRRISQGVKRTRAEDLEIGMECSDVLPMSIDRVVIWKIGKSLGQ
jgi:hypothetical protein